MHAMANLSKPDLHFANRIRMISLENPFLLRRVELEREALGASYVEFGAAKAFQAGSGPNPNIAALLLRAESILGALQLKAEQEPTQFTGQEREAAGHLALFVLYHRHVRQFSKLAYISLTPPKTGRLRVSWYQDFESDAESLLRLGADRLRPEEDAPGLLGLFFQMARAFVNIYAHFVGRSPAAVALRAKMWESIFTHDLGRYRRALLANDQARQVGLMADIPTLITGPSGTGKELVAQAVGRSSFIPFDPAKKCFELDPTTLFLPIHLAALSTSLIESELFGHRRGAFTGALEDRASFLEMCSPCGAVFLDELAEVDATIQVKLLRVLQTREFTRLGDAEPRRFAGRLVSATNRDLTAEIKAGRFREDLFFRLNADRLVTPGLSELLGADPVELEYLVAYVADRLLPSANGAGAEAKLFGAELCDWIEANLGMNYPWPGNFRELEQCAKAVFIRGNYSPESQLRKAETQDLASAIRSNSLTADDLLTRYCAQVFAEVGTYDGAARQLKLDRRTVKARVLAAARVPITTRPIAPKNL